MNIEKSSQCHVHDVEILDGIVDVWKDPVLVIWPYYSSKFTFYCSESFLCTRRRRRRCRVQVVLAMF